MLATICDDTWNVLNMKHVTHNSKRWDCSDTLGGSNKNITGPDCMVEGGHHLKKSPQPHPQVIVEQPYMLPILYCKYSNSLGINRYSMDQISLNIPFWASEELTSCIHTKEIPGF